MKKTIFILTCLIILFSKLSIYRHRDAPQGTFRNEIWADRAGYYVYLPSAFMYGFSASAFPDSIDYTTGAGFRFENNKVITKYTYGVSLLQLPFFISAHIITKITGKAHADGFSHYYQKLIDIAAVFYLVLGMYLLFLALKKQFSLGNRIIQVTLVLLFFGSNLYYYSLAETGMSHVYSFFLFSSVLYLIFHKERFKKIWIWHLLLSSALALIVLIRPSNVIFALLPLVWNFGNENVTPLIHEFRKNAKMLAVWCAVGLVFFIPQFIYWKYVSGNYFTYSYGSEGFSYALKPRLAETLFSPDNGLFWYSPIMLVALWGMFMYFRNRTRVMYLLVFSLVVYTTAAWHEYSFGCGAGMRNMVEYLALFAFPLCYTLHKIQSISKSMVRYATWVAICIPVVIAAKESYHYYGCYFTQGWDWTQYLETLTFPYK